MKAFLALMRREFIEHKGTFLYAPAVIFCLIVAMQIFGFGRKGFGHGPDSDHLPYAIATQLYEALYLLGAGLWLFYLVIALVFYFANAFAADKRNNAMLFWKSMPQGDLRILLAKTAAGLVTFPATIFGFMLATGIFAYVTTSFLAASGLPFGPPDLGQSALAFLQVSLVVAVMSLAVVAWYLPVMAFVGALSSAVGRWSIPLAVLIPAILVVGESIVRERIGGSAIWDYLSYRLSYIIDERAIITHVGARPVLDGWALVTRFVGGIDWLAMTTGWVFAALVIYAAGEWRRRVLAG